jgi:dTDP-4-amino-4,6-dideoxygalactose transaminase
MKVRYTSIIKQFQKYQSEYESGVLSVLRSGWYILGDQLRKFEKSFSKFHNLDYCSGLANGLDALRLALAALGIGKGHEVIVQANTFIATVLAITEVGATPVFVDSDKFFGIDSNKILPLITEKTKAIMVVHLYGQPCEMDSIMDISKKFNLPVIEDCAQAHGARYKGKLVGTFGKVGCFSFYPTKPVGAFGDAGATITNDKALDEKIKNLRNYGSTVKYFHTDLGINSRMDEIQAAITEVSLKYIDEGIAFRNDIATKYLNEISNPLLELPNIRDNSTHVFHIFPILTKDRSSLTKYLEKNGIETQIHYPISCHLAECLSYLNYKKGSFPNSEMFSNQELSLPIYVGMLDEEVNYVCKILNEYKGI